MFDKLKAITNQYEQLCSRMEEPETYSSPAIYAKYEKEARELAPIAEAYREYEKACAAMRDAEQLMSDVEMKELAQEEFALAKSDKERLEQEIKILLLARTYL